MNAQLGEKRGNICIFAVAFIFFDEKDVRFQSCFAGWLAFSKFNVSFCRLIVISYFKVYLDFFYTSAQIRDT